MTILHVLQMITLSFCFHPVYKGEQKKGEKAGGGREAVQGKAKEAVLLAHRYSVRQHQSTAS